jgi:hypothetical protein
LKYLERRLFSGDGVIVHSLKSSSAFIKNELLPGVMNEGIKERDKMTNPDERDKCLIRKIYLKKRRNFSVRH